MGLISLDSTRRFLPWRTSWLLYRPRTKSNPVPTHLRKRALLKPLIHLRNRLLLAFTVVALSVVAVAEAAVTLNAKSATSLGTMPLCAFIASNVTMCLMLLPLLVPRTKCIINNQADH